MTRTVLGIGLGSAVGRLRESFRATARGAPSLFPFLRLSPPLTPSPSQLPNAPQTTTVVSNRRPGAAATAPTTTTTVTASVQLDAPIWVLPQPISNLFVDERSAAFIMTGTGVNGTPTDFRVNPWNQANYSFTVPISTIITEVFAPLAPAGQNLASSSLITTRLLDAGKSLSDECKHYRVVALSRICVWLSLSHTSTFSVSSCASAKHYTDAYLDFNVPPGLCQALIVQTGIIPDPVVGTILTRTNRTTDPDVNVNTRMVLQTSTTLGTNYVDAPFVPGSMDTVRRVSVTFQDVSQVAVCVRGAERAHFLFLFHFLSPLALPLSLSLFVLYLGLFHICSDPSLNANIRFSRRTSTASSPSSSI